VLDGEMVLPVIGQALVESTVLLGGDVLGITSPNGLGLVELLVGDLLLFDRLLLLLLLALLVFINLLDLGLLAFLFGLLFVVFDLL
jgi:hypothetical protein